MDKSKYISPSAEVFVLSPPSLLVNLSIGAGFDEFEPGDGPTEEFELDDEV